MEFTQLKLLYQTLDDMRHENGGEFWYARELYPFLGYIRWENFETAINRAKEACKKSGSSVESQFRDVTKLVNVGGSEAVRKISDIKLTRYACYLIAVNGDPKKEEIAFAQAYFITKTREFEVLEMRMVELERIDAREKLKITEKEFAAMAYSRGVDGQGIAQIRSLGDQALFGKTTEEMKNKFGLKRTEPLADVLPSVTLKAKDLATAMTNENTRKKNLRGKLPISKEHFESNKNVRGALVGTNIYPENLPPAENIKRIEAKHRRERVELERKQRKELDAANRDRKKGTRDILLG
ncbi:DNA damage-inducible protein D [Candidatus Wolfebacteria bacterium]|nr:DNA damage-inducible protein D [Candidatus Wolfebacteria bacterium]